MDCSGQQGAITQCIAPRALRESGGLPIADPLYAGLVSATWARLLFNAVILATLSYRVFEHKQMTMLEPEHARAATLQIQI
jgi:hypothetical protein